MPFRDIKGQEKAKASLVKALSNGKVAHAYLFAGPSGVGKKATARALAKALNCEEVRHIFPQGASLKIDQIREMQKEIYLRPSHGEKRVYILENAEKMTEQAENCLLKILEETPDYAIIILVTSHPYSLLPTIRSRCQPINFQVLKKEIIEEALLLSFPDLSEKIPILSRLANGSLGQAFIWAKDDKIWEQREDIWDLIEEISLKEKENLMHFGEKLEKEGREKIQGSLGLMASFYRDALLWQQAKEKDLLINLDKEKKIQNLATFLSSKELIQMIEKIEETKQMINKNVNSKLALEVLFIQLSRRGEKNNVCSGWSKI